MATLELSGRQRRALRALAHALEPVVHVGQAGVSDGVVRAVEQALLDHELIKVRLHEPADKKGQAAALAAATESALLSMLISFVTLESRSWFSKAWQSQPFAIWWDITAQSHSRPTCISANCLWKPSLNVRKLL